MEGASVMNCFPVSLSMTSRSVSFLNGAFSFSISAASWLAELLGLAASDKQDLRSWPVHCHMRLQKDAGVSCLTCARTRSRDVFLHTVNCRRRVTYRMMLHSQANFYRRAEHGTVWILILSVTNLWAASRRIEDRLTRTPQVVLHAVNWSWNRRACWQ